MSGRRPRGYVGTNHETLGSDILAVLRTLSLPEQVLGEEEVRRLSDVRPDRWYPIGWLIDLMEKLDERVGYYGLLRMGRMVFSLSHEKRVLATASSARDIIWGIDAMYHHANRGVSIGGWKVLRFEPGYAELEKNTPHHCIVAQGILKAGLSAMGTPSLVAQTTCFRLGGEVCVYTVTSVIA
ncbi:MAG TPA: hypothetical protein VNO21_25720, partial [Polyangiaceae bacterium]|nr:hypothetical protein [Polyangiaceae bacterium]